MRGETSSHPPCLFGTRGLTNTAHSEIDATFIALPPVACGGTIVVGVGSLVAGATRLGVNTQSKPSANLREKSRSAKDGQELHCHACGARVAPFRYPSSFRFFRLGRSPSEVQGSLPFKSVGTTTFCPPLIRPGPPHPPGHL